jgi:hypothetical protein
MPGRECSLTAHEQSVQPSDLNTALRSRLVVSIANKLAAHTTHRLHRSSTIFAPVVTRGGLFSLRHSADARTACVAYCSSALFTLDFMRRLVVSDADELGMAQQPVSRPLDKRHLHDDLRLHPAQRCHVFG